MTSLAQAPDNSLSGLLNNITGMNAAWIEHKFAAWPDDLNHVAHDKKSDLKRISSDSLGDAADGGSATRQPGLKGAHASIQGKNPIWAAVKGAGAGGGAVVQAGIVASVVAIILLLVLSPVLLIVFLLSLLIIAAIHRAMRARHH